MSRRADAQPEPARADAAPDFARADVEDFLYHEAALLDEWRLSEWLALFTEDATYSVPPTDAPGAEPDDTLFLIADDAARLRSRVEQLEGKTTWSENPLSRTRRMVANVRIRQVDGGRAWVTSNFVVYRMKTDRTQVYVGRYEHVLVRAGAGFRIQSRRAILDLETLRDVGRVSFIL
jgi:p-cumate 2,3-dioxygenase beta subunit